MIKCCLKMNMSKISTLCFEGIPQSIIPNPPTNAKHTKRNSDHKRGMFPDELSEFNEYDSDNIADVIVLKLYIRLRVDYQFKIK